MLGRLDDLCARTPDPDAVLEALGAARRGARRGRRRTARRAPKAKRAGKARLSERRRARPTPPRRPKAGCAASLGYVLRHRRDVAISFAAAVLGAACQAGAPLLERQIVDGVIVERSESLLALADRCSSSSPPAPSSPPTCGATAAARSRSTVQYDLRNEMQAHLQQMDFATLDRMPTGQLVARASSDTTLVQGLLMLPPDDERQRAADGAVARRDARGSRRRWRWSA